MTRKQQKEYIRSYRSEKNACASNGFCQTIFERLACDFFPIYSRMI